MPALNWTVRIAAGLLVVVIAMSIAMCARAQGVATLSCTAPTLYTNGQPIGAAPITYKFYRGAAQTGPFALETKTSSTCSASYTGLAVGTHWFVVTATVGGVESAQTASVSKVVTAPVPEPPGNVTIASTRIDPDSWTCRDENGLILSRHERQDKAQESCTNYALANLGKPFDMRPSGFRIVAR